MTERTPPAAGVHGELRGGPDPGNNAVIALSAAGALDVLCRQAAGGTHLVPDVNGWFE